MPMPSDADLVQSAQSGDRKAFETLVEKYRIRIYTTISAFIDNPQDREDLAQETFISAYRNLHQLSKPDHFGSWLDTIAQNQCRDWLRKNRIQTVPIDEVEENLLNSDDSPEHRSVEAEQRRIIAQAIDTLPRTERQIARAHYLEDASHDELVSLHGISYQSVSARLFRAKRKLAKRLRHLLGGAFVPPTTALKKISSGGFTAMKIGTASKITVGVIAIIVIAFIGSRQLLSPEEDSSPSAEVAASTADKPDQSGSEIDANRKNVVTAPSRADEPQISAKEMEQIEDFFAQLEAADVQSDTGQFTEAEFRQDVDENIPANADAIAEDTAQSAEEVMRAYVAICKTGNFEELLPLLTGTEKEQMKQVLPFLKGDFSNEVVDRIVDNMPEGNSLSLEALEWAMPKTREMFQDMLSQAKIVSSGYVGDEFHFKLRTPNLLLKLVSDLLENPQLELHEMPEISMPEIPESFDSVYKMRKEHGKWLIYE